MAIKVFVMDTCPDCTSVKAQVINGPRFELIDIGAHILNLKQFLRLRDHDAAFNDAKQKGYAGIPCFLLEDGRVTFSLEEVQLEARTDGEACNLDGTGC